MVSIIVAVAKNNVIGCANKLIWHISEDLKRFKALTSGHPVVMGRRTYESIGRPLPGRTNVVVSRNEGLKIEGVVVANSLEQAIQIAQNSTGGQEVFVIGGDQIYRQSLPLADRIYYTLVDQEPQGDAHFETLKASVWQIESLEKHDGYSFINYVRVCNQ